MRLIHVDNLPHRATATTRMLQAGVGAYNTRVLTSRGGANPKHVDLEVIPFDHFTDHEVIQDPNSTVILITVSERELFCKQGGAITPCRSLATAQNVIRQNPTLRVVLVPISNMTSLTGIDVVAGLVSGVSGIVDERGLVMQEVLGDIIDHRFMTRRCKSMLLISDLVSRLEAIKGMVEEWNMDVEADPTLDIASWRAAMALAQLEKLEPIIGSGHTTSFSTLADTLNLAQSITSFRLNSDDLRRVLGTLARRWLGENHEPVERLKMPEYARSNGFPRHPPIINSLDQMQTSRKIYQALQKIDIASQDDTAGMTRRLVRLR